MAVTGPKQHPQLLKQRQLDRQAVDKDIKNACEFDSTHMRKGSVLRQPVAQHLQTVLPADVKA